MAPHTRSAVALVLAVLGCTGPETAAIPILCSEIAPTEPGASPIAAGDPLELVVVFDSVPAGPGGVRLRVDGLAQPGLVHFTAPPPTAAAAGMTLDVPARYHGCAAGAPFGFELRAPHPPGSKAWVRVSTDRVVRLRVHAGAHAADPVVAAPGESALGAWDAGT